MKKLDWQVSATIIFRHKTDKEEYRQSIYRPFKQAEEKARKFLLNKKRELEKSGEWIVIEGYTTIETFKNQKLF